MNERSALQRILLRRLIVATTAQLRMIRAYTDAMPQVRGGDKPMNRTRLELQSLAADIQDLLDRITAIIQDLPETED